MMRWLVVLLCLSLPLQAQEVPDPFEVVDQLGALIEANDQEGIYTLLSESVRKARETDSLNGDWAYVFALFSDQVRNHKEDSVYALRLAEEGLALLAQSDNPDPDQKFLLNWSRAYSLADLGRLEQAASLGREVMPYVLDVYDEKTAADFLVTIEDWEKGQMSAMNNSSVELALKTVDLGFEAINANDFGRAMTLAAQASLPTDSGLDPMAVLEVNTKAAVVRGRALYQLGRTAESLQTLSTAVDAYLDPGWRDGQATALIDADQMGRAAWELFFWLGRAASDMGEYPLADRALEIAETFPPNAVDARSIVYAKVWSANAQGDYAAADALLTDAITNARAIGDAPGAAIADFYLERGRAERTLTWEEVDAEALIRVTNAVIADAVPTGDMEADFVMAETAVLLVSTDRPEAGLGFARAALDAWKTRRRAGAATQIEEADNQRRTRLIVDTLLFGASRLVERDPTARCSGVEGRGCVIIMDFP